MINEQIKRFLQLLQLGPYNVYILLILFTGMISALNILAMIVRECLEGVLHSINKAQQAYCGQCKHDFIASEHLRQQREKAKIHV